MNSYEMYNRSSKLEVQGSKEDSHDTSLLSLCGLPRDTLV